MAAIAALTTAATETQTALQTLLNCPALKLGNDKSLIQKLSLYNGKSSPDAHHFIAAFTLYAQESGTKLNHTITVGTETKWRSDDHEWIKTALSFLQDEAAVWATPHIEKMVTDQTQDKSADTKEALRKLYQGKLSVPEYVARFREVMARTGYSDSDLCDRFYEHLSSEIKDLLPTTERSTKTLNDLVTVAIDFDTRLWQRKAKKAHEQGQSPGNGKSRTDFLKAMTGWCFGCGLKDHSKKDSGHKRDICDHCGGTGHKTNMCMRRYMGLPKKQKVAAMTSSSDTFDVIDLKSPQTQEAADKKETEPSAVLGATVPGPEEALKALMAQQAALNEQLEVLKKFF
ncbi:hypothetical protein FOMPIDRAFT_85647 [Fomitopsis schrenkii]|uniref:Retrotransposon gag domain-containing protein n=1 Tax=Fomitopsis schrenkii TaxID=2126942 RepID=S8E406_FOMSC|nr:hypothetical protein FOMPIDRAFT_85647 [Fomitopsis schrenkii]